MADDKQKNADFIGHVVGDPKNPQETRMLTGWFGESGEEGCRRLYTDAELSSYIDIPDDAILHSEPLKDVQPSGGVIVWIDRDAALKQGGSASTTITLAVAQPAPNVAIHDIQDGFRFVADVDSRTVRRESDAMR